MPSPKRFDPPFASGPNWVARAYGRFWTRLLGVLLVSFVLFKAMWPRLGQPRCDLCPNYGSDPPGLLELRNLRWGFDTGTPLVSQFRDFMATRLLSGPMVGLLVIATVLGVTAYAWEVRR